MATMHIWLGRVIVTDYSAYLVTLSYCICLQTVCEECAAMSQIVCMFRAHRAQGDTTDLVT